MLLNMGMTTIENVLQLIGLIIIFVVILIATYFTTRWIGSTNLGKGNNRNITVVETYKISQNKYIQIVKVGEKYVVIGISKDHIEYLTELGKDQIVFQEIDGKPGLDFGEIFSNVMTKYNLKKKK